MKFLILFLFSLSAQATLLKDIDLSKLFGAMAYTESRCGLYNHGDDGKSLGMYQVKLSTARSKGYNGKGKELKGKLTNFIYAYYYFMEQYDKFQSVELALAAYNAGPKVAEKIKLPARCKKTKTGETAGCYIDKVFKSMRDNTYCQTLF